MAWVAVLLGVAGCGIAESDELLTVDIAGGMALSLRELPRETLGSIGLSYGLAVVRMGAAAERAGLRIGDVVYGVNQKSVSSARELSRALAQPVSGPLTLLVRRGKTDFYVDLRSGGRAPGATDTPLRT